MYACNHLKLIFLLLLLLPSSVLATETLDVVISEIAWMGTEDSYNNEWIEIYNNTFLNLNLEGWELIAEDGSPAINLTGEILANDFFLLERSDEETVPGIEADLIYKGSLNNEGEKLKLLTPNETLIDEVDCSSGWFTGDNKEKRTMERITLTTDGNNPQNWQTSQLPGGTPKTKEEGVKEVLKEEIINYPSNIVINELLPSPEGPDAENEWIEIFNQNSFKADLSSWQLSDTTGGTKTYIFPEGTTIEAKGFLVFLRPTTKITLNNSEDSLTLAQPSGNIVDKVSYEKAPRNNSFNRINSEWLWSSVLTPGALNILPSSSPEEAPIIIEAQEQEAKASLVFQEEKAVAAIGKRIPETSNFLSVLLTALAVAIASGIIIVLLKKRLSNHPSEN